MFEVGKLVRIKDTNIYGNIYKVRKNLNKNNYIKNRCSNNITISINDKVLEDEIMLRHQTAEEALINLDIFINNALANNIKRIKIIHGKNGGILRQAVHDYLKKSALIDDFRLGNYYEGQYGVTIAILK